MSRNVVIVSAARTAIGGFGGSLANETPGELGAKVAKEAISRSGLAATDIGQTVFGNVIHTEPRDMYVSRVAAIGAGVPDTSPSLTLNRLCGSGLQATVTAAEQIMLGNCDAALAGGAEIMSRGGYMLPSLRSGAKMGDAKVIDMMVGALTDPFGNGHMGITAENIAERSQISREQQDEFALESHRRAERAVNEGRFESQILPIEVKKGRNVIEFKTDEHFRKDAKLEDFSKLKAVFKKEGSVTAGNASGINDGACALVLAEQSVAEAKGKAPLARIVSYGLGGVAPEIMGMGPVPSTRQALERAGLSIGDLDVIESNEAFAAQACGVSKELGLPADIVNPNGGAIALGHPIGASGAVILTKLLYELKRIDGRYGLATMCIGGGQGIAVIVENIK